MKPTDVCPLPGSEVGILGHRYEGHPGPWGVNEHEMKALMPRLSMTDELAMALPGINEYGTMDPFGLDLLLRVARDLQPKRILEIGTFHGLTTRRLAEAAPDAQILTIDLPDEELPELGTDLAFVDPSNLGKYFRDSDVASRITQMRSDSAKYPTSELVLRWLSDHKDEDDENGMGIVGFDLVLIDGAHDYESTKHTFMRTVYTAMSRTAVVFFDDYARMASHTGVTHCVLDLAHSQRKNYYWYTPTGNTSHVALYLHNEV